MQIQPGAACFEVVAHRGARTLADSACVAPENTMPAFQEAARHGAAIELDVIATTNGRILVHHDDDTGRMYRLPGGEKPVRKASFAEMQKAVLNREGHEETVKKMLGPGSEYRMADAFLSTPIPELEEVLEALPNTRFYVELKTDNGQVRHGETNDLERRVADLIREKNLYQRVKVISFCTESLRKIKSLNPKITTGLDFELPAFMHKNRLLLSAYVWFARNWIGVDSLHPSYSDTTPDLVELAHKAGIPVIPWVSGQTRDEEKALFPKLLGMRVDGLITNAVDLLNEALAPNSP